MNAKAKLIFKQHIAVFDFKAGQCQADARDDTVAHLTNPVNQPGGALQMLLGTGELQQVRACRLEGPEVIVTIVLGGHLRSLHRFRLSALAAARPQVKPQRKGTQGNTAKHRCGHSRQCGEGQHACRCDHPALGLTGYLLADLRADMAAWRLVVGGDTGDDHPRSQGNQQRRNLRDQTIANGQYRIQRYGLASTHAVLQHARGKSAQNIDRHNHQAGDGVAFDELHGAVHRPEQLAFPGQLVTLVAGLRPIDQAAAQVTVDGHLLARQRIQAKARRHFGDPLRALGNHQKIDDGDNQKNHQPHRQIAPHHKVAKGLDNIPRILLQQDQAGSGNRQRQTKHRGQQQQCRKRRKCQRAGQIERQHDQQAGDANIQRDQHIHQPGGQRHDKDKYNAQHHRSPEHFARACHSAKALVEPLHQPHRICLDNPGDSGTRPSLWVCSPIRRKIACNAS